MIKSNGRRLLTMIIAILTLAVTAAAVFGMAACTKPPKGDDSNVAEEKSKWKLDFEDEFNGDSLDLTKWKINTFNENSHIRRAGYYSNARDIVNVKDGKLVISTKYKERGEYGAGWYTSWLESKFTEEGKGYSKAYGRYEIRCIAPPSLGIWSAFWLMPSEGPGMTADDIPGTGADGVEIDVMESSYMYDRFNQEKVIHVLHGDGYNKTIKDTSRFINVPKMYEEFHTYAVEWNPKEYIFYVDGVETWRTKHSDGKGGYLGVSETPQYMILSVEIGGDHDSSGNLYPGKNLDGSNFWCGNPNSNDKSKSYDFIVDYVKVYQPTDSWEISAS